MRHRWHKAGNTVYFHSKARLRWQILTVMCKLNVWLLISKRSAVSRFAFLACERSGGADERSLNLHLNACESDKKNHLMQQTRRLFVLKKKNDFDYALTCLQDTGANSARGKKKVTPFSSVQQSFAHRAQVHCGYSIATPAVKLPQRNLYLLSLFYRLLTWGWRNVWSWTWFTRF